MSVDKKTEKTISAQRSASRKLHPEDISVGDDLALSEISCQYPTFLWCAADATMLPPDQKVRVTFYPWDSPQPLKVKSVCLPLILCEHVNGTATLYDVRQVQFMRLDPKFASLAHKALSSKKKSKRCNCKSKKNRRKNRNNAK